MARAALPLLMLVASCAATPPPPAPIGSRVADAPPDDPPDVDVPRPPVADASSTPPAPAPPTHANPALDKAAKALAGLSDAPSLTSYGRALDGHKKAHETRVGEAIRTWSKSELGDADGATILYPFSGPDFLTVHRMFPRASRYVLASREEAGKVEDPEALPRTRQAERLDREERMMESFLRRGFFLTRNMGRDFPDGVAGTLAAFAAMEGLSLEEQTATAIDPSGALVADPRGTSLRLSLRRPDGAPVTLDFVSVDLSDPWLRQTPRAKALLTSFAKDRVFLKAASHLLQEPGFRLLRDVIVDEAKVVVEDETGVAYARLVPTFDVALYGAFTQVNSLFGQTPQRELAAAFKTRTDVKPLPFSIGYKKPSGPCLLIARRSEHPSAAR